MGGFYQHGPSAPAPLVRHCWTLKRKSSPFPPPPQRRGVSLVQFRGSDADMCYWNGPSGHMTCRIAMYWEVVGPDPGQSQVEWACEPRHTSGPHSLYFWSLFLPSECLQENLRPLEAAFAGLPSYNQVSPHQNLLELTAYATAWPYTDKNCSYVQPWLAAAHPSWLLFTCSWW